MATAPHMAARPGRPIDAVDGVVPRHVVEPTSAAELGEALATASRERHATILRGGGTKVDWGRVPLAIDLVVSTGRLNTSIVHRHGDLTATAHAGVTLKQLNHELARYGQWLPIDSAFDAATIGGIVATGDAGPLRHRYGTPRDLLIGVTLAMADGRVVKAGGHVVKNVAGYDLGRLVSGSFGSLAAIADATFKLLPLPQASATVVADYDDPERLAREVLAIGASQIEPTAFDLRVARTGTGAVPYRLLLRVASSSSSVDGQIESARRMMPGASQIVRGESESTLWTEQVRQPWNDTGAVVRLGWLPAKVGEVITLIREVQKSASGGVALIGRVGAGAGLLTVDADALTQAAIVQRLRGSVFVGNVTVLRGSRELKSQVDVWHASPGTAKTLQAVKQRLDPAGILNPGRGPI